MPDIHLRTYPLPPMSLPTARRAHARYDRLAGALRHAAVVALVVSGAASADAGKARAIVVATCSSCHGIDGNSTVPDYPKLAGRHPDHVARELQEFVAKKRRSHVMEPIAEQLDAADFKAIGEYFAAQTPTSEPVRDPLAAEAGKKLYMDGDEERGVPACAGCHVFDGTGNKRFPRLAGQHREYLIAEMHKFRRDERNAVASRLMREVAKRLTDDEIKAVAEYLTGL